MYPGAGGASARKDADETPHGDDGADGEQPPCSADVERCVDTFWGFPLFVLVEGKCVTEEHRSPDCEHELREQIVKPKEFKNVHRQNRSWRTLRRVVRWLVSCTSGLPIVEVGSPGARVRDPRGRLSLSRGGFELRWLRYHGNSHGTRYRDQEPH